mgnify:CR=1 FL=1
MNDGPGTPILRRGSWAVLSQPVSGGSYYRVVQDLPPTGDHFARLKRFDIVWEGDSALMALRLIERAEPKLKTMVYPGDGGR